LLQGFYPLFISLLDALKFPDSPTFSKLLAIYTGLLPVLLDVPNKLGFSSIELVSHARMIGADMTSALLASLNYNHSQPHCSQVISLLAMIYQSLLPSAEAEMVTDKRERPDFRPYFFEVFSKLPNCGEQQLQVTGLYTS
jgi:hypothetical protein